MGKEHPKTMKPERLKEMYEAYHKKIFSLCLHFTRRREDAEDITQEVFVKVARSQDTAASEAMRKAWLYRIATHACFDYYRWHKRTRRALAAMMLDAPRSGGGGRVNPDLLSVEIQKLLGGLPTRTRMMVLLKYLGGFTHAEIAQLMNQPENTVKSTIFRALKALQEKNL